MFFLVRKRKRINKVRRREISDALTIKTVEFYNFISVKTFQKLQSNRFTMFQQKNLFTTLILLCLSAEFSRMSCFCERDFFLRIYRLCSRWSNMFIHVGSYFRNPNGQSSNNVCRYVHIIRTQWETFSFRLLFS